MNLNNRISTKDVRRQKRKYKKTNIGGIQDISNVPEMPQPQIQRTPNNYSRGRYSLQSTPQSNYYNNTKNSSIQNPRMRQSLQFPTQGLRFHKGPDAVYSPKYFDKKSKSLVVSRGERISMSAHAEYRQSIAQNSQRSLKNNTKNLTGNSVYSQKKNPPRTPRKEKIVKSSIKISEKKVSEKKNLDFKKKVEKKKKKIEVVETKEKKKEEDNKVENTEVEPFNYSEEGVGFDSMEQIDSPLEKVSDLDTTSFLIKKNLPEPEEKKEVKINKELEQSEVIVVHHRSTRIDPINPIYLTPPDENKDSRKFKLPKLESKIMEENESLEGSTTKNITKREEHIVPSFSNFPDNEDMNTSLNKNRNVQIPQAYSPKTFNRVSSPDKKKKTVESISEEDLSKLKKKSNGLKKINLKDAKFEEFEKYDSNKNISIQFVSKKNHPQIDQVIENCGSPLLKSQNSIGSGLANSDPNMSLMSLRKEIVRSELKNFAESQISITFPQGKDNEVDVVFGGGSNSIPIKVKGKRGETQDELKKQIEILIQSNTNRVDLNHSKDLSRMLSNSSNKGNSKEHKPSIFKSRKSRSFIKDISENVDGENVLGGLEEEEDEGKEATQLSLNVTPNQGKDDDEEESDQIELIGENFIFKLFF